uniref:Solute carrier family 22 member 21 n=1 Tax=Lates calcarifer TaxID=8187 RepID=A0A4W6E9B9_LATCA
MTDYEAATAFLGEWGPFQQQVFFLLCLSTVPNGFTALAIVFLADTPSHRCLIPEHVNLTAAWRNSSIPLEVDNHSGALVPSKCSRYKLNDMRSFSETGLLPGVDVNLSNVPREGCLDGWEYDRSVYIATIVSEWDLVCDNRWKNPLTSSVFFCGVLTGSFISGQLSDRYGRKTVLVVTIAVQILFTFFEIFSQSWAVFCALYFVVGVGQISNYVAAFVLGAEIFGPSVRTIFSTAGVSLFFGAGYMLLPLFAFFIRDWRMLLLALTLLGFLCVPVWWYVPESPRWLLMLFMTNNYPHRNTLTIAYFVLSLNTGNLHGDAYFNCFLSAVVEMPAYTLSWVLFRWCSRRLSLSLSLFMGGLFLLLMLLIPANLISLAITLEMAGKFAVTTAFAIVYAYSAELYPTVLRNTAVGACSMASRIGSIIAPYFIYLRSYSISLPYILVGSLTALSGLLSLLLPESYGMPLPETIAHMQRFPGHYCMFNQKETKPPRRV